MLRKENYSRPIIISAKDVMLEKPNRCYYITYTFASTLGKISNTFKNIYQAVQSNFGLNQFNLQTIKELSKPLFYTTVSYTVGEQFIQLKSANNENKYFFQLMIASSFLLYSAMQNITQTRIHSQMGNSIATAADLLAINYIYSASFHGSLELLNKHFSESQSLVISLGASAIAVPALLTSIGYHYQTIKVKKLREKGAQISDTATTPNGLTRVSNIYFQLYHFLTPELFIGSRLFQLLLISENILHAENFIQKYRNLPAMLIDIWPGIVTRLKLENKKLKKDYEFNTKEEKVLVIDAKKKFTFFKAIQRKDLRTNHLVFINEMNLHSFPLSGEIEVYGKEDKNTSIYRKSAKISVNYKAKNGEDNWQLFKLPKPNNHFTHVSLSNIKRDQQAGVLRGVKLDLNGEENAFIRIKPEEEFSEAGVHEKKSVINQIINRYKSNTVRLSIIGACLMASFIEREDFKNIPFSAMVLLLNLFQMMIPFSENFLRDMINANLMNEINKPLLNNAMETVDALCVTDFCNTLAGYYSDIFPSGSVIVSDKTGTLTTSKMEALGFWINEMKEDTQSSLEKESKGGFLVPTTDKQLACFTVFVSAFQNSKQELELEEFAILDFFKKILMNEQCLAIERVKNNHFIKTFFIENKNHSIETRHLGLYRSLGGRFTLVNDDKQNYYLVYCGIPKGNSFLNTPLLKIYLTMKTRENVLSRDWCIARAAIDKQLFVSLMNFFEEENEKAIEGILINKNILSSLEHYGTFLINNPVKAESEKFISNCENINLPIFIATGDTAKASENIARVLCKEKTKTIISISSDEMKDSFDFSSDSTVIFSGINEKILKIVDMILKKPIKERPMVIFSEMSTVGKGLLVDYLKLNKFFVVASGDGTNDKDMMRKAHLVIGHVGEDGHLVQEIEPFVHLNDKQLQRLLNSNKSFYQLFDIHQPRSLFIDIFACLANSQEKPSIALILKSAKMSFEFMRASGCGVTEMPMQHFSSIVFDLGFLGITFNRVHAYSDLPIDNQHLVKSMLPKQLMVATVTFAFLTAALRYATSGESVNWDTMGFWLLCLPIVENILFSSFGTVQNELTLIHPMSAVQSQNKFKYLCFFKKKEEELKPLETQVDFTRQEKRLEF
jgi:Ca2+-transporting ATPase